jgi:hypothetical protein
VANWEILLVEEVAEWFYDLTKNDPDSRFSAPQHEGATARIDRVQ